MPVFDNIEKFVKKEEAAPFTLNVEVYTRDGFPFFGVHVEYSANPLAGWSSYLYSLDVPLSIPVKGAQGILRVRYLERVIWENNLADLSLTEQPGKTYTLSIETEHPGPRGWTDDVLDEPAGKPNHVQNLRFVNSNTGRSGRLVWDEPPGSDTYTFLVYVARTGEDLYEHQPFHLFETQLELDNLAEGVSYTAAVFSMDEFGRVSNDPPTIVFTPSRSTVHVSGVVKTYLRSREIAPGDSSVIDLASHVHLRTLAGITDQNSLWASAQIDLVTIGGAVTGSASGSQITLTADAGATTTADPTLILVRVQVGGYVPLHLGLVASIGLTTQLTAPCVGGVPLLLAEGKTLDLSLLTQNAQLVTYPGWEPRFHRYARMLPISGGQVQIMAHRDGIPQVAVLSGDDGYSVIVLADERTLDVYEAMPMLPPEDPLQAEVDGVYLPVSFSEVTDAPLSFRPSRWVRVLTSGGLYDVHLFAPPVSVYYTPPLFYGDRWFNEDLYPEDASLRIGSDGKGSVVYRSGLATVAVSPSSPAISNFQAVVEGTRVRLSWDLTYSGERLSIPVDVVIRTTGGNDERNFVANDALVVEGLAPVTTYECIVAGTLFSFTTGHSPVELIVTGWYDGTYQYRVRIQADEFQQWTDPEGGVHTEEEVQLSLSQAYDPFFITITYTDSTTEKVSAEVEWTLPGSGATFEVEFPVGTTIDFSRLPAPKFFTGAYAGSSEVRTVPFVAAPGKWKVEPIGYLPIKLSGELEDYVSVCLEGPGGIKIRDTAEFSVPTEVVAVVKIESKDGRSPVVYGVRLRNVVA
ncbi:MAG: hypothetical protein D6800_03120 [Candidatus Zixiibacteriota bacterium]|nr:MAG: hypothetical protein D6800_03120 [candidate division Zixibacteria bacterium]